jgi:DNA polymerase-4
MQRHILHLNVVSFYVAVARSLNPRLRGAPVAVATAGRMRRVILDASSEARQAGVYRGMPLDAARRQCGDLLVQDPLPGAWEQACEALRGEAAQLSPRVEPAGPGHVFVDLSGTTRLLGGAVDVGERLRRQIEQKYRLSTTVGVAANKLVSKVATRVIKPVGMCSVVQGCEETFLAPLPVYFLPGLDMAVVRALSRFNVTTVSELHGLPPPKLATAIGPVAYEVDRLCRGIDPSPVQPPTAVPAIREAAVLPQQTNDEAVIRQTLQRLVIACAMTLRSRGLAAAAVELTLTYADGSRARRGTILAMPVNGDLSLLAIARRLLTDAYTRRVRLAGLSLRCTRFSAPWGQLDLFGTAEREEKLMGALDKIRTQYGQGAVGFAAGKS